MNTTRKRSRNNITKYEDAYHLYADMIHDHGNKPIFKEIVGNLGDFEDYTTYKTDEDNVLEYFIGKETIRKSARLLFTTTETTALFQGTKKHAVLFSTGNNTIGIVHDNGSKIFKQLDTRNLITFGSVLDQAGKPISPADEPVYYDGYDKEFKINAAEYGFSPSALSNVIISKFKGGGIVNCVFEYSNGSKEDAIARKMISKNYKKDLKYKPINSTDIDRAGYFTSIAEIESLDGFNNPQTLKKYYMGKALGDIMLVASISPSIQGILNPFIPNRVSRPALLDFKTNEKSRFNILHYVLKTTDRLNYVRAVIKGVHSILQVMPREGNEGYYEFFPGMIENESIRRAYYISMIRELATKAEEKYNALIGSFENSLDTGLLKPAYSMFHKQLINGKLPSNGNLSRISIDPTLSRSEIAAKIRDYEEANKFYQQLNAGKLILKIINALKQIKQIVSDFFRQEYTNIQTNINLSIVSNTYSKLCDQFNCLTPQRTEILHNGSMIMDIIVIKMKNQYINIEFEGVYRIQLYNAFKDIGENKNVETIPFLTKLYGTQVGGAELEPRDEYYDLFNDELLQLPYGTDEDYAFVNPKPIKLINHYPLLISFMKFVGKDSKQSCNLIWNAYRRRFSNKIFDHEFLRRTCNEMLDFVRASYGEDDYYRIESIISIKDYTNSYGENNKVTPATLLFNAFTFHINAKNARLYGFLTDESIFYRKPIYTDNELSLDYENLSTILKEAVYMMDPIIISNIENSTPIPTSPGTTSPILFINKAPNTPPKNRKIENKFSNSNSNINAEVSSIMDSQEAQTQEAQISARPVSRLSFSITGKSSTSPKIPGSTSPKILVSRPGSRPSSRLKMPIASTSPTQTSPRQNGGSRNKTNKKKRPMYRNKTKRVRKSLIDV